MARNLGQAAAPSLIGVRGETGRRGRLPLSRFPLTPGKSLLGMGMRGIRGLCEEVQHARGDLGGIAASMFCRCSGLFTIGHRLEI